MSSEELKLSTDAFLLSETEKSGVDGGVKPELSA